MTESRKVFIYEKFHGILSKILQTLCQTKIIFILIKTFICLFLLIFPIKTNLIYGLNILIANIKK